MGANHIRVGLAPEWWALHPPFYARPAPCVKGYAVGTTDAVEARRQRGLAIATTCRIERKNRLYAVPSQSGKGGRYWVDPEKPHCTCPDFELRGQKCKHVFAVEFLIQSESNGGVLSVAPESVGEPPRRRETVAERPTYKQDWPAYNAAQTHEKDRFLVLLHDLCRGIDEPLPSRDGRTPIPLRDSVFSIAYKVYSTFSARRFASDLRAAREKGYISRAPHHNSLSRCMEDPQTTPILYGLIVESSLPLRAVEVDFAADSSGFSTSRFVRWVEEKYGTVRESHDWVKVHLMCGVKTNVVTAVRIGGRRAGDAPMFKPMLATTAQSFRVREVAGDGSYASNENFEAVAEVGGMAFFNFKANATGSVGGLYAKMFHLYCLNRDDYLARYHKRSNVESTFSMIKAKFRDHVRSKTDVAMANEVLCKILCHNICCLVQSACELGIEAKFWGEEPDRVEIETESDPSEAWAWM